MPISDFLRKRKEIPRERKKMTDDVEFSFFSDVLHGSTASSRERELIERQTERGMLEARMRRDYDNDIYAVVHT